MSRSNKDKRGGHTDYAGKTGRRSRVKWLAKAMNRRSRYGKSIHKHSARWDRG